MKLAGILLLALLVHSVCNTILLSATPAPVRKTDSGFPLGYQDNPYDYKFGRVVTVDLTKQDGQIITNFTFQPVGTYLTFTEQVPLCGDQNDKLNFNIDDVVVITMTKRMTRRFCHDLLRIDVIEQAHSTGSDLTK